MIRLHLGIISVLGGCVRCGHDSSVVGKAINLGVLRLDLLDSTSHRVKVLQVAFDRHEFSIGNSNLQLLEGVRGAAGGAVQKNDLTAFFSDGAGGNKAGSRRRTGNHKRLAFKAGKSLGELVVKASHDSIVFVLLLFANGF